jgi:hypothetical protein
MRVCEVQEEDAARSGPHRKEQLVMFDIRDEVSVRGLADLEVESRALRPQVSTNVSRICASHPRKVDEGAFLAICKNDFALHVYRLRMW